MADSVPSAAVPAPTTLLAALLAAAALAAGCGSDDESEVREALDRYAKAVATKDYQTICDELLAEELKANLRSVQAPCETAIQRGFREVDRPTIAVRSVKVDGDTATAVARSDAANQEPSEDTIRLVKEDGDWKVVALSSE
jgi:ketosteroid isomerase-like protein